MKSRTFIYSAIALFLATSQERSSNAFAKETDRMSVIESASIDSATPAYSCQVPNSSRSSLERESIREPWSVYLVSEPLWELDSINSKSFSESISPSSLASESRRESANSPVSSRWSSRFSDEVRALSVAALSSHAVDRCFVSYSFRSRDFSDLSSFRDHPKRNRDPSVISASRPSTQSIEAEVS
jgi:hypothetical protein